MDSQIEDDCRKQLLEQVPHVAQQILTSRGFLHSTLKMRNQ